MGMRVASGRKSRVQTLFPVMNVCCDEGDRRWSLVFNQCDRGPKTRRGYAKPFSSSSSSTLAIRRMGVRASTPFKPDIGEIANAGRVRVVAVAEPGDIDQVRRRRILLDLGIDPGEVDPLVEPAADPIVAGIGTKCGKPPMYL